MFGKTIPLQEIVNTPASLDVDTWAKVLVHMSRENDDKIHAAFRTYYLYYIENAILIMANPTLTPYKRARKIHNLHNSWNSLGKRNQATYIRAYRASKAESNAINRLRELIKQRDHADAL